ncbi:MAG: ABC transporter permease subunit [bacterium]|nr:ABC transporter permease subunit [bacterium]
MIGNIHLGQSLKGIWVKLLLLCVALFVFQMLFSILGTSEQIYQGIMRDMDDIPPIVEKMFGKDFVAGIVKYGIIAFGYLHPFTMVVFILIVFIAASQMVTSEITGGSIGFILSKPVSRKRIYVNLAIVIYISLALQALFVYASSALGVTLFHGERLSTEPFAALVWNLFLLMVFIAGYIAIFAAVSDTGKALFTWGGVTLLVFYILNTAAPLWQPLKYLAPINPFSYYNPMPILMGSRVGLVQSLTIIGVSLIMFAVGGWIFSRRDIAGG